jgi:hypothetical protein
VHRNNSLICIQQDATLHRLSRNCSIYFGWYHHLSSGAQTTVSVASGICHTVMDRVKFTDEVYIKIRLKITIGVDNVFLWKMQYVLLNNEWCTYPLLLFATIVEELELV